MKAHTLLSRSIAAALAVTSIGHVPTAAHAATAAEGSDSTRSEIQEVVVTATRRSESLQNVPISAVALTAVTLRELQAQTFNDYVAYLPNVSASTKGPGQGEIYMRGLSATQAGSQTAGSSGPFPNVAVYLDDQSVQLPGRNLDIYAADIERVEVLKGPQGTLFGAGAQAGAIRYITAKPKLNVTEFGADASYSTTAHGDPSNAVSMFVNIPLIQDKLSVRGVFYNDARGGYIKNIPGTFSRSSTDRGIQAYFGGVVPPGSTVINNSNLVGDAINPAVYKGARASLLYKFNEDWDLGIQQSFQTLEADGVFSYNPELGDLKVQQYNQSSSKDRFSDTAWTLNGKMGPVKAVYTGAFLNRKIDQTTDYTAYARGYYAAYYQCNGPSVYGTGTTDICYSPSATWQTKQQNLHSSHEVRLSTPDDWRLRAVGGVFYEDFKIKTFGGFFYASPEAGFFGQKPYPGTTTNDPSRRPDGDAFFSDAVRGYTQKSAFGELAFDLVPSKLTLTVGTRLYNMATFIKGSVNVGYGCRWNMNCSPGPYSKNLDALHLQKTYTGHADKVTLSWKPSETALLYATYSVGFRPGGFNLGQGVISRSSPLYGKLVLPLSFSSDTLKNYELGWKTTWLHHRLQFNGALYRGDWNGVQLTTFDPSLYGNIIFTGNGPNYRVRGLETDITFKLLDGLTVASSFAWNHSEQVTSPTVTDNTGVERTIFPTAGLGSPLAQSPPFAGNIRARYERTIGSYDVFIQLSGQHQAHSYASVATHYAFEPPNYEQAPYTTYDASVGVSSGAWATELYAQNLTDKRAQLYINGFDFVRLTTPNRPRVIGVHASYRFKVAP